MAATPGSLAKPELVSIQQPSTNGGIASTGRTVLPIARASSEDRYLQACARSNQRASLNEPLTLLFAAEKLPPLPNEPHQKQLNGRKFPGLDALRRRLAQIPSNEIEEMIYVASYRRLRERSLGAFVAEVGNFAAVTAWEPRYAPAAAAGWCPATSLSTEETSAPAEVDSQSAPIIYGATTSDQVAIDRPIFATFIEAIEKAREKHLYPLLWKFAASAPPDYLNNASSPYTQQALQLTKDANQDQRLLYWRLCMTSRDPAVQPPVPGAIRAIIEPFVKQWIEVDGMPAIWLEAGSPRARDVYSYFGFRVVDRIDVGMDEDGNSVPTWFMVCTKESLAASKRL